MTPRPQGARVQDDTGHMRDHATIGARIVPLVDKRGQLSPAGWGARTAWIHSPCALGGMLPAPGCTLPPSGSGAGHAVPRPHARTVGGDN